MPFDVRLRLSDRGNYLDFKHLAYVGAFVVGWPRASTAPAVFAAADVTDEAAVRSALDAADELGTLRVLVNCAGIGTPGRVLGRTARRTRSSRSCRCCRST